jgi:hypothetical protein
MFSSNTTQVSDGGYQISRSLRFNSADSAYLNRTPASATNRKTWTWSAWVKRSALLTTNVPQNLFGARNGGGSPSTLFRYDDGTTATATGLLFQDDNGATLRTTAQYRDVSAWYHIVLAVDTTQATASNRVRIYINGVEVTAFSTATYPTQNLDMAVNSTNDHRIGNQPVYGDQFNGYMTEINFIDGSQLTPSSFGETNAQTGVWQPKAYSGSYGTNGFYLNFSDNSNTTAATLGKDYSGNGNNWTPNNFSVTAGAGNDSLVDSPTSYGTDTGVGGTVRGNYATMNPLRIGPDLTLSNGNLDITTGATSSKIVSSTIGMTTGKWYWEATLTASGEILIGVEDGTAVLAQYAGSNANTWAYDSANGQIYNSGSGSVYGASLTTGDVLGIAVDADAKKIWFAKNGTWQNSGSPTGGTNAAFTTLPALTFPVFSPYNAGSGCSANFGQRPFAYTAPSGYKALCTQNLPTPTIGATTATQAGKFFNPVLYTGTGSNLAVTGVGFQPDFIWTKSRSAVDNHVVVDAVRGIGNILIPNSTGAASTYNAFNSFDSDGFTKSSLESVNGRTYVAWNWKANGTGVSNTAGSITSTVSANTTSGFSVVTYTGTGTTATIGHGLGVAPSMLIFKSRSNGSENWNVYHKSLGASTNILLNSTIAAFTDAAFLNATAPTSTVLSVGGAGSTGTNQGSGTYVCYAFAEVAGYSKFGSYTGNGSNDGPFVFTGMRPAYVMIKRTNSSGTSWNIFDTTRSPFNVTDDALFADLTNAEAVNESTLAFDILSNGFKLRTTGTSVNGSGDTYIYMAFASAPLKFSLAR